jgi:ribosomal protein S14
MIHGGIDDPVNNLPFRVRSLTFGSDTDAVFRLGHWHLGHWSKVLTPKIGTGKRLTWAEFGKRAFDKDACGREHAFIRQKGCFALGRESIREYVMTWPECKEGTNWWWVQDGHWRRGINLSNKCCNRGRLGVVLGQGYKYEPLVFVIGIKQFHNKPDPWHLLSPFSRVVEFFERSHRSVDLRKYRQPCIMSSIMRWI